MRLILNILWLVLAGFWMAVGYVIAGLLMLIPIVTIPFSIAAFRIAGFALWPFGRTIVDRPGGGEAMPLIGNVLWILLAGWWLALGHLLTGLLLCVTIIGIPFGIQQLKLTSLCFVPLGREGVSYDEARGRALARF